MVALNHGIQYLLKLEGLPPFNLQVKFSKIFAFRVFFVTVNSLSLGMIY